MPLSKKRGMIDRGHPSLSISAQCRSLGIQRTGLYYKPVGESALNLELMRLMDERYLHHPTHGVRMMHDWLTMDKGFGINLKRVRRLYRDVMGLRSILPAPKTTERGKGHKVYPYLLRDMGITRPNQVWSTDITYIPMRGGFLYLTAIIDLYSRYVVAWSVSNSMDAEWCVSVFEEAVSVHGAPDIINTDQGSQYTSAAFTAAVKKAGSLLSMDGKGRCLDNVLIERLWWSVKYEKVYINEYNDGTELWLGLTEYFDFYNNERRHSSLGKARPVDVFFESKTSDEAFGEPFDSKKANLISA